WPGTRGWEGSRSASTCVTVNGRLYQRAAGASTRKRLIVRRFVFTMSSWRGSCPCLQTDEYLEARDRVADPPLPPAGPHGDGRAAGGVLRDDGVLPRAAARGLCASRTRRAPRPALGARLSGGLSPAGLAALREAQTRRGPGVVHHGHLRRQPRAERGRPRLLHVA